MIIPTYTPGPWYAVITDGAVALLPPAVGEARLAQVWDALRESPDLTHCLTVLARGGLVGLPPFALVSVLDGHVRGFLRGDVRLLTTTADGTQEHSAAHVATWAEINVADVSVLTVAVPPGEVQAGAGGPLAALAAVVRATSVEVSLRPSVTEPGQSRPVDEAPRRASTDQGASAQPRASTQHPSTQHSSAETTTRDALDLEELGLDEPASGEPRLGAPGVDEAGVDEHAPVEPSAAVPAVVPPAASLVASAVPASAQRASDGTDPLSPAQAARARSTSGGPVRPARPLPPVPPAPHLPPAPPVSAYVPSEMTVVPVAEPTALPVGMTAPPSVLSTVSDDDIYGSTVLSTSLVEIRRQMKSRDQGDVPGPFPVAPVPVRVRKIRMSSGLVVPLDRAVLIGRAPVVSRVSARDLPRLVTVVSPNQDISRTHAQVHADGEDVLVTDLNSTNGMLLVEPGHPPRRLRSGEPTPLGDDAVVDLGDGVTFTLESDR